MKSLRTVALGITVVGALAIAAQADRRSSANIVIAVADFSGPDKETSRLISETMLTSLAQSNRLRIVERSEIRRALVEIKFQSTGLSDSRNLKQLGRVSGADRLLVGSYVYRDQQVVINVRLLDVQTGQVAPSGAVGISGPRNQVYVLSRQLASQLHRRITGADLNLDSPGPVVSQVSHAKSAQTSPEPLDGWNEMVEAGLIPAKVRPNDILTERDFQSLLKTVRKAMGPGQGSAPVFPSSATPVTRARAVVALTRMAVSQEEIDEFKSVPSDKLPPDVNSVPSWATPHVSVAVEQGWWLSDVPLRAKENSTWAFIAALLSRMPVGESKDGNSTSQRITSLTGLVIDARGFNLQRAMAMQIVDESGTRVYPDPKRLPGYNFLQDHGTASYCSDPQDATRSGINPIMVRAIAVTGNGRDTLVVTDEVANMIREANRKDKFLDRWAVVVLVHR